MSDFDPKAFLAETDEQDSFDPKAFLAETGGGPASPTAANASWAEQHPYLDKAATFIDKAANAVPVGKQAVDSIAAGVTPLFGPGKSSVQITPQARAEMAQRGIEAPDPNASATGDWVSELNRMERDRGARVNAEAGRNPITAGLGTAAGVGLSLAAPMPKVAAPWQDAGKIKALLGRVGAGGLTGLGLGAIPGIVQADARQAYVGGGLGLGVGAAVPAIAQLLESAAPYLASVGRAAGRRVLSNKTGSLSNTSALPDAAVDEAARAGVFRPLSTTEATAQRLESATDRAGNEYGNIVNRLSDAGVKGPDANKLATELRASAAELRANTMNQAIPAEYETQAQQVLEKSPIRQLRSATSPELEGATRNLRVTGQSAPTEPAFAVSPSPDRTLDLVQAENLKRSLQKMAKYGKFEDTPLNEARKDIASMFRQRIEGAVDSAARQAPEGSEIPRLAEEFVPAKQKLGNLLDALGVAEKGVAAGAKRSGLSLTDKIFAASRVGAGDLLGAAEAAGASKLLGSRGPSTIAALGYGLANKLSKPESVSPDSALKLMLLARSLGLVGRNEPQ